MLEDDVIERTKYNIGNKPSSLSVIGPPESIYDFKCISYYRQRVYKRSQKVRMLKSTRRGKTNMCEYTVEIETGDVKGAGTDSKITISMTGKSILLPCFLGNKQFDLKISIDFVFHYIVDS